MSRYPWAAETLLTEVQGLYKSAKMEPTDEADGLDVHRTFTFSKATTKYLTPHIDALSEDSRIASVETTEKGVVVVFSHRTNADLRHPFGLRGGESDENTPEGIED